jgi:hypothetical protein
MISLIQMKRKKLRIKNVSNFLIFHGQKTDKPMIAQGSHFYSSIFVMVSPIFVNFLTGKIGVHY